LSTNNIDDKGAKELAQGLPDSQVRTLDLSSNKIGPEGTKELAQGLPDSQVQALYLGFNNIDDEGAKELAQGLPRSQVRTLDLSSNKIGPEGAKGLAQGLPDSHVQALYLGSNNIGNEGVKKLANVMIKDSFNNLDLDNILTPDAKKALTRAEPNTPLEVLDLSNNVIATQGARTLCLVLPQTHIRYFSLSGNPIDSSQVDPQTCLFSSNAVSVQPTGPYARLYQLCYTTLHYAIAGYQDIAAHWPIRPHFLPLNAVDGVPFDSSLPKEITINEAPVIKDAPPKINENEPLFTFRTTLVEITMVTASSRLLEPLNRTSKNPFSFFNTLAKTNQTISVQPFNSNFPVLPKPVETHRVSALGAIGAVVTGMLAVGYLAWKKVKSNNNTATIGSYKARLLQ
jgi:hypothetical protein